MTELRKENGAVGVVQSFVPFLKQTFDMSRRSAECGEDERHHEEDDQEHG